MRRSSIFSQIGGLALLIVIAVQAISVTVVLLTPPPAPARMNPSVVRQALIDDEVARAAGWTRSVATRPPFATTPGTGRFVAMGLAESLSLPSNAVRVRMTGERGIADASVSVITRAAPQASGGSGLVASPQGLGDLDALAQAAVMVPAVTLPAFEAAMRQPDGRWIVVAPPDGQLRRWLLRLAAMLGVSLLVLAPLIWWAARQLTLPVTALVEMAGAARLGKSAEARFIDGPREVVAVADALNDMRDRLTHQVEQRTQILAAVAHDLRTPLTSLRLRAETAPPAERDRMAADIDRMEAMIVEVLDFSTASATRGKRQNIVLADICRDVVRDTALRGCAVTFGAAAEGMVEADPDRVRRVLSNLIENAVRYGGSADVTVVADGTWTSVIVADRGPGVSFDQIEALFEPFYRLESSRNRETGGAGLGLTICKDLAEADNGRVTLRPRDGGGLEALLSYALIPEYTR